MNLINFRKPSRYINSEINVIKKRDVIIRVALVFPDLYEIGMSHLGIKILYHIINSLPYASAERVFAPGRDLRDYMREKGLPLTSLETNTPLDRFDIIGISLQYELSYTTMLEVLDLGGVPLFRVDRDKKSPLVIAGGPSAVNPLPVEDFMDAFCIGDAEEAIVELLN
ncbi:MAG: B12-binding domain-containing radical SAM protein, partial [Nitrospirae bacterium]|nr:B12-binding domain-containing radical SAM protein [Nitrospirota bacterium]